MNSYLSDLIVFLVGCFRVELPAFGNALINTHNSTGVELGTSYTVIKEHNAKLKNLRLRLISFPLYKKSHRISQRNAKMFPTSNSP